ncbi:MAG TPA: hypothetical protein VGH28_10400 [Polyangiaceae bacterium]|jgi:hypothetical protein
MSNFAAPQQRNSGMSGCAIAALVLVVLACCIGGGCVLCVAVLGHESKAERARSSELWDAHISDLNARTRAACDAGPNEHIEGIDDDDFRHQCRDALKAAIFPDPLDEPDGKLDYVDGGCSRRLRIVIMRPVTSTAKHKIQTGTCTYDPRTSQIHYSLEP